MDFIDYDMEDKLFFSANGGGDELLEDDELGETPDWSKLQDVKHTAKTKKKLNKSGFKTGGVAEKEFAPLQDAHYDANVLQRLRSVMFDTLSARRGVQSTMSQVNQITIFYNSFLNKCYMYSPKGTFLKTMGKMDKFKRCWLEAEELIYLIERGSCIVKDDSGVIVSEDNIELDEEHPGYELSLEEIYSLLIRTDDDFDRYCVYANLKRLGYLVMKSSQIDSNDDSEMGENSLQMTREDYSNLRQCISQNLSMMLLGNFKNLIFKPLLPLIGFIKRFLIKHQLVSYSIFEPHHFNYVFHKTYLSIFSRLGIFTSNHNIPYSREEHLKQQVNSSIVNSDYATFTFDVWKPTPNFSKKNPPLPDFKVCVVNVNKNKFPSLQELRNLMMQSDHKSNRFHIDDSANGKKFANLKKGYRNFIVAVVDNGVINYMNLKELDFLSEGVVYKPVENHQSKTRKPQNSPLVQMGVGSLLQLH